LAYTPALFYFASLSLADASKSPDLVSFKKLSVDQLVFLSVIPPDGFAR
jgi:hypothetical protein